MNETQTPKIASIRLLKFYHSCIKDNPIPATTKKSKIQRELMIWF